MSASYAAPYHLLPLRSCYSCAKCQVGDVLNCENGAADKGSGKPWLDGQTSRELKAVVIEARAEQVAPLL